MTGKGPRMIRCDVLRALRRARPLSRRGIAAFVTLVAMLLGTEAWAAAKGEAAPACAAIVLDTGAAISLADYRGSVVYLDFWASWCGPCRASFPFMNELQRDLAGKGLRIVAISVDKTAAEAQRFALDTASACPTAFRLEGMPSSFVIDRTGTVRAVHVGFRDKDRREIRRQLAEVLDEPR
ncbi:MAG: TlpA family protein disulfide reductase [Betaproteobacteria bacterium]|nr:MAG: TlpA family protein disulfide reductase [Betaproteobacteria bacterium]